MAFLHATLLPSKLYVPKVGYTSQGTDSFDVRLVTTTGRKFRLQLVYSAEDTKSVEYDISGEIRDKDDKVFPLPNWEKDTVHHIARLDNGNVIYETPSRPLGTDI